MLTQYCSALQKRDSAAEERDNLVQKMQSPETLEKQQEMKEKERQLEEIERQSGTCAGLAVEYISGFFHCVLSVSIISDCGF